MRGRIGTLTGCDRQQSEQRSWGGGSVNAGDGRGRIPTPHRKQGVDVAGVARTPQEIPCFLQVTEHFLALSLSEVVTKPLQPCPDLAFHFSALKEAR